ncbi:uncharacterized protein TNCV_393121 [Trichonephila clavipes]|nr:uncharacterized protein TNCV_393121 [Trichonephila clavipes]
MKLTVVPWGKSSNPGEDMDVCKCIVPSRNGGTLNSSRTANPLVRSVQGEERWEASCPPPGYSPSKMGLRSIRPSRDEKRPAPIMAEAQGLRQDSTCLKPGHVTTVDDPTVVEVGSQKGKSRRGG